MREFLWALFRYVCGSLSALGRERATDHRPRRCYGAAWLGRRVAARCASQPPIAPSIQASGSRPRGATIIANGFGDIAPGAFTNVMSIAPSPSSTPPAITGAPAKSDILMAARPDLRAACRSAGRDIRA